MSTGDRFPVLQYILIWPISLRTTRKFYSRFNATLHTGARFFMDCVSAAYMAPLRSSGSRRTPYPTGAKGSRLADFDQRSVIDVELDSNPSQGHNAFPEWPTLG